jgi:hypothetical protein
MKSIDSEEGGALRLEISYEISLYVDGPIRLLLAKKRPSRGEGETAAAVAVQNCGNVSPSVRAPYSIPPKPRRSPSSSSKVA